VHWLKHAFAVEPPGPVEPTSAQRDIAEKLCAEVVRRRLSTPALLFLETTRPLNFLGAQVLHFFSPFLSVLGDAREYKQFASFLEKRGSLDYLCQRIEALQDESEQGRSEHDESA